MTQYANHRRRQNRKSVEKIEQWLSPLSDHFPTPRGFHFLPAPIVPSTPSAVAEDCDADETSSEASSSNPSSQMSNHRESIMTDATEFDDMYDVSDDDRTRKEQLRSSGIARRSGSRSSQSSRRVSRGSPESRKVLAPLVIPPKRESTTDSWSAASHLKKKITSPVPPTPSSKVELSPVQLAFMEAQQASEIPTISAPPSLDGSLNSEELAVMSAPPTPLIGAKDDSDEGWSGVQLQPGALATLQTLSSGEEELEEDQHQYQVIEVPQEEMSESRRQAPRLVTNVRRASAAINTPQQRSLAGLTKLDIPSPGGFFSELSSASRNTWHVPSMTGEDELGPPTSTTAEQFYKTPWNKADDSLPPPPPRPFHIEDNNLPSAVVERVVEMPQTRLEDLPTAIRVQPTPEPITARRVPAIAPPQSAGLPPAQTCQPSSPVVATEIVVDYDPDYARQQLEVALSHLDRTEMWLMAQRAYLNGIVGPQEGHEQEDVKPEPPEEKPEVPPKEVKVETKEPEPEDPSTCQKKKTVRFSEAVQTANIPKRLPSKLMRQESAYYRAFTDFIVRSHQQDAFVHRQPRFEALQAQRVSLPEAHRNQLLGKFQLSVVPQSAKKRMSANVARGDDQLVDDPEKLRADKEQEAFNQMSMAAWHVAATKSLNGGQLISAPVAKRLARQSRMLPGPDGVTRDRARILDLGGQGTCDWGWHAALKYPNTKVYTVTTKEIRQLSNSRIRGPPNHRQVAVERLTKLPFSDNQFDVVSARELHSILKFVGENGEDEWEACLAECSRVLKPGGYLEFSVLDSDIINAGPRGLAKSVEFGFTLNTLGYDPSPTRMFLGRLDRAGFSGIRRAWMCLPMGPKPKAPAARPPIDPKTGLPIPIVRLEAMVTGSADAAAALTGLAAGWSWERWLLRTEAEKMAGELRLSDTVADGNGMREAAKGIGGVHDIVEEGRAVGASFRMLRGYARKPSTAMGVISMVLDTEL